MGRTLVKTPQEMRIQAAKGGQTWRFNENYSENMHKDGDSRVEREEQWV